ncbi:hypothetical protein [Methanobacterium sp. ACI-7]|uniref:hypothetical protein n=1 Tax=unclassified Methanobacterium TaxID=2627676 RepID=UPI0039C068E7
MGSIEVLLMVVLFIVLMVFVFSTALLTPIIGKKNLLFVVSIGFIVGIIGGAFFISPIMDDIPGIATSFYVSTSSDKVTIKLDISTDLDINQYLDNARKVEGVKNIQLTGITVKTTPFSEGWKATLPNRIVAGNKEINSAQMISNDMIEIQLKDGANSQEAVKKLDDWLMLIAAIDIKYSLAHASVQVDSSKIFGVSEQLSKDAVVTGVEGPTQDKINYIKSIIPDKNNVIILCGFLGVLVGLAGLFIDTIAGLFDSFKDRIRKKENKGK